MSVSYSSKKSYGNKTMVIRIIVTTRLILAKNHMVTKLTEPFIPISQRLILAKNHMVTKLALAN